MAMQVKQEVEVQSECTTAEVTHVLEAIRLEGQCYMKNHVLMALSGEEGAIREWHDNVTRKNLDTLRPLAKEIGVSLPFPKPLEERENEIKAKLQNANVANSITMGEALAEVKTAGMYLTDFYATSITLATNDDVRKAFRTGFTNVTDNLPRVVNALKDTENYFPPPVARKVGLVNEKGVKA